ncbi:discoidin domain-containing protein [Paenibacillus sp. FSL R10-2796]|uniref:discoidin domain-containing protein n=1 Tax=Paenibacillus sp. FSL R10-2796 TaxID=2954663 RepID=UPI0030D85CA4
MLKKSAVLVIIASMLSTMWGVPPEARAAEPARKVVQAAIPDVSKFPNNPAPYSYMDWKQRALDYDAFVYDWNKTSPLPTIQWDETHYNLPYKTFKMPSYLGDIRLSQDGEQEAVNMLASIAGASLSGVDKTNQNGMNYVDLIRTFKHDFNDRKLFFNWPNPTHERNQTDWWYDLAPNMLYYIIADLYPDDPHANELRTGIADALYKMTVNLGGPNVNFWHQSYNHDTQTPVNKSWKVPEAGMISGLIQYWEYKRTGDAKYLNGAKWSMNYYNDLGSNPYYEVGAMFAPYIAARMNAEEGTNYDLNHLFKWILSGSSVRGGWGTIQENWNGYDAYGLQGSRSDGGGYAFLLNTFATAFFAPVVKYDSSYANVVGKWLLNSSNAARFFYADQMPADKQYYGTKYQDAPEKVIAYEGLRKTQDGQSPRSTGDPHKYWSSWGCGETCSDLGLYGSSWAGFFGAILKNTNVEKILQIDLNALDFYQTGKSLPTYLYYNPYQTDQNVQISLSSASDLFDVISGEYVARNVSGSQTFHVPASNSVVLVVAPSGSKLTYTDNRTLIDRVPVVYANAPQDLAQGKTVKVSSVDKSQAADLAVDGDPNTRWASTNTDPQWMYVDLQEIHNVNKVRLSWEAAYGKSYKIQVSNDASIWTDVYSTTSGNGGIDDISFTTTNARYVRMCGTERGTTYGYSLYDFKVYAAPETAPDAPVGVQGIGGDGTAIVSFVPPVNNGGSAIQKYKATAWLGATAIKTVEGMSSPITLSDLYIGSEYTFTVTAVNAVGESQPSTPSNITVALQNLAKGKQTTASSSPNAQVAAGYAVDGDPASRWGSEASDPQWIYVDLGSSYKVNRVKLNWEAAYSKSYKIEVSDNAADWTEVYSTEAGDGGIDMITFDPVNAQYVRMYGTQRGTNYGYSLYEFDIYRSWVPTSPTGVSAAAGDREATVSFTAPMSSGTNPILSYRITAWEGDQAVITKTGASSPILMTGLENGKTYRFTVIATSAAGDSQSSDPSNEVMPVAVVPVAPGNLQTTAGNGQVELTWDTSTGADSYEVYKYEGFAAPVSAGDWVLVQATVTTTTYRVTELVNGKSYAFAVKAVNKGGTSDFSVAAVATPTKPLPGAPVAPDNLQTAVGNGQVELTWDTSTGADSYEVYKYEGFAAPVSAGDWVLVQATVTTTTYRVTELVNGKSYAFAVKAVNKGGTSDFSVAAVATPTKPLPGVPAAPGNLQTVAGNGQVALTWNASTGADSYAVFNYEGTSAPETLTDWVKVQEGITGTNYTVTELTNGTRYVFAVKAVNTGGESVYSAAATATPMGPHPQNPVDNSTPVIDNSVVKSSGGSIVIPTRRAGEVSHGDQVIIAVPAGTAEQELCITIEKVSDTAQLKNDLGTLVSEVFEILKNLSGNFKHNVKLTLKFDPTAVKAGERVAIFYYDEAPKLWVEVGGKVEGNRITAEVDHFTKFAVLAVDVKNEESSESKQPLPTFMDIAGHWAEKLIRSAAGQKLVGGYPDGSFQPDKTVTRAEFTFMLMNALKTEAVGIAPAFKDQEKIGAWATKAVDQAYGAGIISGYEDGSFRPDAAITRTEMAVMIAKALGLPMDPVAGTGFTDDEKIPSWAKAAVKGIQMLGIIQGRGAGHFASAEPTTRAEAVTMLLRMLELEE